MKFLQVAITVLVIIIMGILVGISKMDFLPFIVHAVNVVVVIIGIVINCIFVVISVITKIIDNIINDKIVKFTD